MATSPTAKPLQLVKDHPASQTPPAPPNARVDRPLVGVALHALIPFVILGLWALAIRDVPLREMSDIGLVSVMPVAALALLALLAVSFCVALREQPLREWVTFAHVVVLIVMLYGVTAFLEPQARVATVYGHAGIVDTLVRGGGVDGSLDANFSWPGFFALGALMSQAAGLDGALALAPWTPLAINLLLVAPLLVIFRWASDDPRVWWLGLFVFFSANWVGQDRFWPQAMGFLLWLAILGALLSRFVPRPAELLTAVRSATSPVADAVLVIVIVVIHAAIVSGSQLTPLPATLTVGALVVVAALRTRILPIVMLALLAAWISYPAAPYLAGDVEELAGFVDSTSTNLGQNMTTHVAGSAEHTFIVDLRLVGTALIWIVAAAGFARRLQHRRFDLAFVLIGVTPLALVVQPYGGEVVPQVFLFILPVVAFFVAALAYPTLRHGRGRTAIAAVAVGCLLLLGLFQFMRYGNERLDHFTSGDVAVVNAMYRVAEPGATLIGASNLPWRAERYADYTYRSILELRAWKSAARPLPAALVDEMAALSPPAGAYVIVTRSMEVEASMLGDKGGVLARLVSLLSTSPGAKRIFRGVDGDVFHLAAAAPEPEVPIADPAPQPATGEPAARTPAAREPAAREPAAGEPAAREPATRERPPAERSPAGTPPPAAGTAPPPIAPPPPVVPQPAPRPPALNPPPPNAPPPPSSTFDDSG